jgi:hypothetical protein
VAWNLQQINGRGFLSLTLFGEERNMKKDLPMDLYRVDVLSLDNELPRHYWRRN